MVHKYSTFFRWINVVVDYLILNIALFISLTFANSEAIWMDIYDYRLIILLLNLGWFYCSHIFEIYSYILKRDAVPTIIATIASLGLYTVFALIFKVVLPHLPVSTLALFSYYVLFPALIIAWRFAFLILRKHSKKFWANENNIAIVGSGNVGISLYNYMVENPQLGYNVAGVFDDDCSRIPGHIKCLGKTEDSILFARANKIQEIFCALPTSENDKIEALMQKADKHMIRFRLVPDIKGAFNQNFMVQLLGYMPVLIPRQEPLDNKANEFTKRIFDVLFSSLIIVFLLSWLIPLLGIIIKIDSKGPIFFKQLRSGKDNKPFYCLKFRSMAPNQDSDAVQATKDDMRVTKVGKFIRKTSIDELPQFINVFLGDMSVVGPRPHMLKHTEDYSELINNYMVRHFLTPGITGWAQVNGCRGETKETIAMLNRVQADLWYLENWSLFLDMKIVFLTIIAVLKKDENVY